MKFLRIVCVILLLSMLTLCFASCAGTGFKNAMDGGPASPLADARAGILAADEALMEVEKTGKGEGGYSGVAPGQLTAAAWDDNTYYSMWNPLFEKGQTQEEDGKFVPYADGGWNLFGSERVKVTVTHKESPARNVPVLLKNKAGEVLFRTKTDANGCAYLFGETENAKVVLDIAEPMEQAVPAETAETRFALPDTYTPEAFVSDVIELMFVVDVTGSMGDEIAFLQAELGDVIKKVVENNVSSKISLAFLFYRDHEDDVTFRYVDFADVTNPADYTTRQAELAKEKATGGGDYPEALDEALDLAVSKQWTANATKIIFTVLDAPCHDRAGNKKTYSDAVRTAAEKGIHICPVLASGADTMTEYLCRSAALLTDGTFIYITDDSGIGGEHLDPDLPNVVVEYLNALLVRVITGYHTGDFGTPVYYRTGKGQ